jgi:hypothetical protein
MARSAAQQSVSAPKPRLDQLEVDPANFLRRSSESCCSGVWIGCAEGRVISAD